MLHPMREGHSPPRADDALRPVVVFAPLGANPAPLLQLVWALHRHWHLAASRVVAVVDARGHRYLHAEALNAGAAWDKLKRALGATAIDAREVEVVAVRTVAGDLMPSDEDPEDAAKYNETAWSAARKAISDARDNPVIFALVAGRRRTMHVAATVLFQLLARPQDRLLDVRVTERWAETAGVFYFPEQARIQPARHRAPPESRDPASVDVVLVDVQVPRLRSLLRERDLMTYAAALRAGQAAVDASASATLRFDLPEGKVFLGEHELPLSKAQFIWYATLARHRRSSGGTDGWLRVRDVEPLWNVARRCSVFAWSAVVQAEFVEELMGLASPPRKPKEIDEDNLRKMRADTVSRLRKWAKGRPRELSSLVMPEKRKLSTGNVQRLALDPDRIEFIGIADW
jgi:CRISPR-associated protein (TIGR02584 family)